MASSLSKAAFSHLLHLGPEMQLGFGFVNGDGSDETRPGFEEGMLSVAKFNFSEPQTLVPCPFHYGRRGGECVREGAQGRRNDKPMEIFPLTPFLHPSQTSLINYSILHGAPELFLLVFQPALLIDWGWHVKINRFGLYFLD